jgi:heat shock protein HslJ
MFCEGVSGNVEIRFMQALEQTKTWELRNSNLLLLKDSDVLARFAMGQ